MPDSSDPAPLISHEMLVNEVMKLHRQSQADQQHFDETTETINDHADKLVKLKEAMWKCIHKTEQIGNNLIRVSRRWQGTTTSSRRA